MPNEISRGAAPHLARKIYKFGADVVFFRIFIQCVLRICCVISWKPAIRGGFNQAQEGQRLVSNGSLAVVCVVCLTQF
jgi:hypothetical protein